MAAARKKRASPPGEDSGLELAILRYSPPVAATAKLALGKLRKRFPGARLLIYERRRVLPIGFAPAGGSPLFSVVLYQRWVRFFFLEGIALEDPERRLEGEGNQVRSLRLDDRAEILDDPYILGLMEQAQEVAGVDLRVGVGGIEWKSRL